MTQAQRLPALADEAMRALAIAKTFDEVKTIRNGMEGLRQLAKSIGAGQDAQNRCAEIKLRAERRMGSELAAMEIQPGRPKTLQPVTINPTLDELGVSRIQSHRWQRIAGLSERTFERIIADTKENGEELTEQSLLREAAKEQKENERDLTALSIVSRGGSNLEPVPAAGGRPKIKFAAPVIEEDEVAAVAKVLRESHMLTNAGRVAAFEESFVNHVGGGFATAVTSCTAALHMALLALNIKQGDEVIVPALTFVACAHAIEAVGATPVFVDSWHDSGVIDPELIKAAITPATKAIMVVHFAGRPCYMGTIIDVARERNIPVIEDCATALGARHSGRHVGLIGDIGCFSFHPVKHLAIGEGGMLLTKRPDLAARFRLLREFGKRVDLYDTARADRSTLGHYDITHFGLNFRMTEMQAAIGVTALPKMAERLKQRRRNYAYLQSGLKEFASLDLSGNESASYCYVAICPGDKNRDEVRANLTKRYVESTIYYPGPLPLMTYYREKYGYKPGQFPIAEQISNKSIALPVGPHLGPDHMAYIVKSFKEAVAECGSR
jgi:perosamine synthetase